MSLPPPAPDFDNLPPIPPGPPMAEVLNNGNAIDNVTTNNNTATIPPPPPPPPGAPTTTAVTTTTTMNNTSEDNNDPTKSNDNVSQTNEDTLTETLKNLARIPEQNTLLIVNSFIVNTVDFVNKFGALAEKIKSYNKSYTKFRDLIIIIRNKTR